MADKSIYYLNNLSNNTERGPSEAIWGAPGAPNAWVADFIQDPRLGMHFYDDFLCMGVFPAAATASSVSCGNWSLYTGSNAGTISDAAVVGGVIQFQPSSGTVSTGASNTQMTLSSQVGAFQVCSSSANASNLQGRLAFECRVALTSVAASMRDAFIGLADKGSPSSNNPFTVVSGGSTNLLTSTRNFIGFYNPDQGGGQDWQFVFGLASTATVFCSNLGSLVSNVTGSAIAGGTYYKLGFVYDPNAITKQISSASDGQTAGNVAKAMLQVYVNGQAATAFETQTQNILTASFPTGVMGPVISFANVSTSGTGNSATSLSGVMNVDWIRVAQNGIT